MCLYGSITLRPINSMIIVDNKRRNRDRNNIVNQAEMKTEKFSNLLKYFKP